MENNVIDKDLPGTPKRGLGRLPSWLKNKYFIAIVGFAAILLFFDKNDIFMQMARRRELHDLEQSKLHYMQEVKELNSVRDNLATDPNTIEKYAREKYLMKKDNEDLYLIPEKGGNSNN